MLHSPVEDALAVPADARLVLVEGLFLLTGGPWDAVAQHLDISLFLGLPTEVAREQASRRKAATNSVSRTAPFFRITPRAFFQRPRCVTPSPSHRS